MDKPNPPSPLPEEPAPKKQKMSTTTTSDDEDFDPAVAVAAAADDGSAPPERTPKYKRRKIAIFFAYCGVGYQGMQKNPGAKTIEGDLEEALFHAGAVPEKDRGQPKRYDWARSARTDKGVSAVGQVVSGRFYIDPPGLVDRLNSNLAPQIRIFGYKRATASFNAKKFCDRRRYVYLIPVFALDPSAHRDRESVLASLGSGNELVKCLECSERGRKVIGIMGKRTFDSKNELSVVSSGSGISSNTGDSQNQQENMNNSIHSGSGILSNTGDSQNQQENMTNSIDDESKPNSEIEKKAGNETSQDEKNEVTNMEVEEGNEEAIVPKKIFSYGDEEKDRFNRILKYYEGTHNFHNFTTRTKAEDPAAKRYIISFTANTVVEVEGIDFVKCEVVGQSFMLHQIRKMIGLALAIMRNCAPESLIETAFSKDVNINVPMAPEVGLYLDECFFSSYNKRWTDHEELSMKAYADVAEDFKMKYIYSHIASTEHKEGVMGLWLHSLNYRNYPDLRFSNCDETTDAKSVEAANIPDSCTVNNGEALDAKTVEGAVVADSCAVKNNESEKTSAKTIESNDMSRSCASSEADACPGKNDEPANAKTTESNDMAPSSAMSEADAKTVEAADNADSCPGKNDESATAKTTFEADAPDAKTVEADSCPGKNVETATAKTTFEADAPDAKTVEAAENTDPCPGKNDESASAKATESNAMTDVKSIADEDMAE
ncbi:tRNA pseudouridine synthase 1 isoform X2 [Ipomoea triloba]|uniref:tRNA pseudouridine synthase 1 isoform X2 n=1 Tax=Ipomoea triloba TaxID=35885 RepID=UPI00125E7003|nr:tRNA pseudouridine synthase 1 isoform X2 [Ipomoea triloba]